MKKILLAGASVALLASPSFAAEGDLPSREEMWKMIQTQQKQIETLTDKLDKNEDTLAKTEAKVEQTQATTERVALQTEEHSKTIAEGLAKLEPAGGSDNFAPGWWKRTSIGGYAEVIANKGSSEDEIDARRFVLFLGHEFNEDIRAFAEIEVEHADEIFLEQAYLEFDIGDYNYARIGGLILPIGILNEKHEPTTFFGAERNPIETNIIPTTLREGGIWFGGHTENGFGYDLVFHSGLNANLETPTPDFLPRGARGRISQQEFEDFAGTARIKYTGIAGVELASSINYQEDLAQGQLASEAEAILYTAHADIRRGPWGLRALGAIWDIDGSEAAALGRDEQYGYYIEPSYRFKLPYKIGEAGIFARFNSFDNSAGNSDDTDIQQYDFGFNYWPHENVVLKTDIAVIRAGSASGEIDEEVFNFGAGWVF